MVDRIKCYSLVVSIKILLIKIPKCMFSSQSLTTIHTNNSHIYRALIANVYLITYSRENQQKKTFCMLITIHDKLKPAINPPKKKGRRSQIYTTGCCLASPGCINNIFVQGGASKAIITSSYKLANCRSVHTQSHFETVKKESRPRSSTDQEHLNQQKTTEHQYTGLNGRG